MITLHKVDATNVWDILRLSVSEAQKDFVAPNHISIIEAYTTITSDGVALPFGLYNDDQLVGFVMFGYGTTGDDDEPKVAEHNYCIWRFMIDQNFQHQGLGRKALEACLDYLHTYPCGPAQSCWLSYEPENIAAKALYASMGFQENGEVCGDEIVAVRTL